MTSALELFAKLQERENVIEVAYDGIKESLRRKVATALRHFIEEDNKQALVSVKLLDQHRVVNELVGPTVQLDGSPRFQR